MVKLILNVTVTFVSEILIYREGYAGCVFEIKWFVLPFVNDWNLCDIISVIF